MAKTISDLMNETNKALSQISDRLATLTPQVKYTPVKFTVAKAGYLMADAAGGALTISLSVIPEWASVNLFWIVIDPGNIECEVRKATSVDLTAVTVNFASGGGVLTYAHSANDTVIITSDPTIEVAWFGAKGDGATDDTTSIQRALIQLQKLGGGVLHMPAGTYNTYQTIDMPGYTTIRGDGQNKTTIESRATGVPCISSTGSGDANRKYDVCLHDLMVFPRSVGGVWPTDGIYMSFCSNIVIDNVVVNTGGRDGINLETCNDVKITGCKIVSTQRHGIRLVGTSTYHNLYNRVDNCIITTPALRGIAAWYTDYTVLSGNVIVGAGLGSEYGIDVTNGWQTTVVGNIIKDFEDYGIYCNNVYRAAITGNTTYNNTTGGIELAGDFNGNSISANRHSETVRITHGYANGFVFHNADSLNIYVPADDFNWYIRDGGGVYPMLARTTLGFTGMFFGPNDYQEARAAIILPTQLSSDDYHLYLYYANVGSGGNVRFRGGMNGWPSATALNVGSPLYGNVTRPNLGVWVYDYFRVTGVSVGIARNSMIIVAASRDGGHGDDTYGGETCFLGARIVRSNY